MDKIECQRLVCECRASGMTARAWCETKGIPYRRYVGWASRLNQQEKQNQPQEWAAITLGTNESEAHDEIKLVCGKWTLCVPVGFNPSLLAHLIRIVDGAC